MLPLAGVAVAETAPSTKSLALTAKLTTAPVALAASTIWFGGRASCGAVVSRTVTVKLPLRVLPAASLALTFTVVTPSGKVLPLAGVAVAETAPSTKSVALTAKLTTAPVALAASATILDGRVSNGGVMSNTVIATVSSSVKLPSLTRTVREYDPGP